jgi:hypothetical protein
MITGVLAQHKWPAPEDSREPVRSGLIQRCGARACPPRTCDHDGVQISRNHRGITSSVTAPTSLVRQGLQSSSRPLEAAITDRTESYFGHDLSRVRVHTDNLAVSSADYVHQPPIGNHAMIWVLGQLPSATVNEFGRQHMADANARTAMQGASRAGLKIGQVDDPLEHEADRAAELVMHTPGPGISATAQQLSRKCASCEDKAGLPSGLVGSRSTAGEAPGIVEQALRSPGQPLDASSRAYFEPRFGYDFSNVRVHCDQQAAKAARAIDALAFTVGHHVVFQTGLYGQETEARRKLLAHELAHTVQQSSRPDGSQGGAVLQRTPADDKPPALPEATMADDPQRLPRYIDNLFQSVAPPSLLTGATTFYWGEGAAKKKITIPLADLEQNERLVFVATWRLHASKDEALKTVELYNRATPGFRHYSFYLGKDGVVMPTSFSQASTPNFHELWPDLKRLRAAEAADIAKGYQQLAGAINPFPCTEVDEKGNLTPALNFTNCALPILLHAHSVRSAKGPRLPTESEAPPAKTSARPEPPAAGESPRPPAAQPTRTEPVKTEFATPNAKPTAPGTKSAARESAGAAPPGTRTIKDPFTAKEGQVVATSQTPSSQRTSTAASRAEFEAYDTALHANHEFGIQRPGNVNQGGPDFITARRDANGQIEVIVNDATINPNKKVKSSLPATWRKEVADAIAPGRLDLGDPQLEAEIRQAVKDGRVRVRTQLVTNTPEGKVTIKDM